MVEQLTLNNIFRSLADPTRRDILARVYRQEQTISQLAGKYDMSFAAIAKHITVLEQSHLISKSKRGKEQIITINGESFEKANEYLKDYALLWSDRLDRMEDVLQQQENNS